MTATDISEDMVATANKTASDVSNMATMVADAQNLEAFEDNSMDVVLYSYLKYLLSINISITSKTTYIYNDQP